METFISLLWPLQNSLKNDSWPWQLSKQLEHGDFVVVSPVYCQRKAE